MQVGCRFSPSSSAVGATWVALEGMISDRIVSSLGFRGFSRILRDVFKSGLGRR